jgi:hypothetical protein
MLGPLSPIKLRARSRNETTIAAVCTNERRRLKKKGSVVPNSQDQARFAAIVLPHHDAAFNLARWVFRSDANAKDRSQEIQSFLWTMMWRPGQPHRFFAE